VDFFSHHWTGLDRNGKIIFYPSQAIETYQCPEEPPNANDCVTNDLPDIAGLYSVIPRLLNLPSDFVTPSQKAEWTQLLNKLPPVPTATSGGTTYLVSGDKLPSQQSNSENPELYAVHPYRLYGVGKPNIAVATESYKRRVHVCNEGWCQDIMDAALLGLTTEAMQQVISRATTKPAPGYRFPGFMPHFQDYPPSSDHLSNMNNALQWMLIQPADDAANSILLFPAWPCKDWNVDFKLKGPQQTTLTGSWKNGKLDSLTVDPPGRRQNVKFANCAT